MFICIIISNNNGLYSYLDYVDNNRTRKQFMWHCNKF